MRWQITSEMWETLNATWIELRGFGRRSMASRRRGDAPRGDAALADSAGAEATRFFDWVKDRSHLFRGVTYGTIVRGEAFNFSRLGTHLERADNTARILDVKYFLLLPSPEEVGGVLDELQWISLLRSAGAYQMFRQSRQQAIQPKAVAAFLLLDPIFPRSVRYCLERIHETLKIVKGESVPGAPDELECLSGLTLARWSYTSIDALIAGGLHESIDELQSDFNRLHELIEQRYFIAANIAATNVASSAESPCVPA